MRLTLLALGATLVIAVGCEPEIGLPCDPDQDKVLERVKVGAGTNDLVKDVAFDTCSTALCTSTDGSRPYCTKQCEADIECAEAGAGFTCQQVVDFGVLACQDFTPLDECPDDGSFPCDCINADGQPSEKPLKYCAASPAVIDARDVEFGRPPFVAPE
ncbi:MAG: hypothetical protein Q8O67_28360 [Deltaproteobacteria bacterium]|nr:hypothetical protein [Deltaproteobacteria bacterium]